MIQHDGVEISFEEITSLSDLLITLERLGLHKTFSYGMDIGHSTITGETIQLAAAIKKRIGNAHTP